MNIIECKEMKRIKKHQLIPTVIDHIFTVCKNDQNFKINENIEIIDKKLKYVDSKIYKQEALLENSNSIKQNLLEKIKDIDNECVKLKIKVLEELGSEL